MNRAEFMRQLEALLYGVSVAERQEAMQYYADYFDDAGLENETDVIRALSSPAKVAETIKAGLSGKMQEDWEYTETGFHNGKNHNHEVVLAKEEKEAGQKDSGKTTGNQGRTTGQGYYSGGDPYPGQGAAQKDNTGKIILLVVLAVLFSPLWISLAASVFGVLFGAFITVLALMLAVVICSVAFLASGVGLLVLAFATLMISPLSAVVIMGAGLLMFGLGILLGVLCLWICKTAIPACAGLIARICKAPFHWKGGLFA